MAGDVQQGIEQLTQIVERNRILKLSAPEPIRGRMAFYFVAKGYDKEWLFTLSHEALSDLPAMKKYQQAADRFARGLEGRFRNKSADLFLCASGVPVVIQSIRLSAVRALLERLSGMGYGVGSGKGIRTGKSVGCWILFPFFPFLFLYLQFMCVFVLLEVTPPSLPSTYAFTFPPSLNYSRVTPVEALNASRKPFYRRLLSYFLTILLAYLSVLALVRMFESRLIFFPNLERGYRKHGY